MKHDEIFLTTPPLTRLQLQEELNQTRVRLGMATAVGVVGWVVVAIMLCLV